MGIEWKPEYSVKVEEIDDQHKHLVAQIDRLSEALYSENINEETSAILDELSRYAIEHFETEEKYFDKFHYIDAVPHKEEHLKFQKKIETLIRFHNAGSEVSIDLIDFLEDWLIDHLMEQDQKYVECFRENGLK
jgi:hemerythrin-like metal-binding protein